MRRTTTIAGLLLATGAFAASAVPAQASTSSDIRKLKHDLKVVAKREKQDRAALAGFVNCLQFVNLTQYGDGAGTFGYLWSSFPSDPTMTIATTGIDATAAGDLGTKFLIINPACSTGRSSSARVFGPMIPVGKVVRVTEPR